jgi:WS/DGAT/MGAT family acyltransferase
LTDLRAAKKSRGASRARSVRARAASANRSPRGSRRSRSTRLAGPRDSPGARSSGPLEAIANPREGFESAMRVARGLRGMLTDVARPATRDPLAVPGSGLSRRLDISEVSIERLRKIKSPLGVTINDVVLTALTGALRAYHHERHVHADELSCLVPMNLRGRDERDTLGNRVGMFTIALPVGEKQAARRMARIVEQTRAAKRDRRGAAAPLLVEALTLLPGAVLGLFARGVLGRVNVACTNVPGTHHERWMAGARIESIHPFASVVEGTPLVMALLSYAGKMEIGIDTDPEAIPDPHRIATLFGEALDELEALADRASACLILLAAASRPRQARQRSLRSSGGAEVSRLFVAKSSSGETRRQKFRSGCRRTRPGRRRCRSACSRRAGSPRRPPRAARSIRSSLHPGSATCR